MLVLTNFERFPSMWTSSQGVRVHARVLRFPWQFLWHSPAAELVVVNGELAIVATLCLAYALVPRLRRPLLVNDIVLRQPISRRARLTLPLKRWVLSRVDHFTLYFRQLDGYQSHFGIGPDRASYLPFKVNLRDGSLSTSEIGSDGDYVLCFGYSERDYDAFFDAMERLPDIPALIPPPRYAQLRRHASRFTRDLNDLPPNVGLAVDDGSTSSLTRMMLGARLVVIPTVSTRIGCSGIGSYLNAMFLGKCVVMTDGPGASDVLTDQALIVPPHDVWALTETIRRAWNDPQLRRRTAAAGQQYALTCGGEAELRERVLERALEIFGPHPLRRLKFPRPPGGRSLPATSPGRPGDSGAPRGLCR